MTSTATVLARSIDELVAGLPNVVRLYSAHTATAQAAHDLLRAAKEATGAESDGPAPLTRVRVENASGEVHVTVSVGVTDAVPAAETGRAVAQVVRTAIQADEELTGTATPTVQVRIASILSA